MKAQAPSRERMSKDEYRYQWMRAQEEIADLIHRAITVQSLLPALYEGVLSEPAPRYEPRASWDTEDDEVMAG